MAKLVDALDLGSNSARSAGSIPVIRTSREEKTKFFMLRLFFVGNCMLRVGKHRVLQQATVDGDSLLLSASESSGQGSQQRCEDSDDGFYPLACLQGVYLILVLCHHRASFRISSTMGQGG